MAIVEGVFLRDPRRWAAACRRPDGSIAVATGEVPSWYRQWGSVPLARGIVALAESLSLGVRALLWSGDVHRGIPGAARHPDRVGRRHLAANLALALSLSVALFFVGPAAAAHWLVPRGEVLATLVESVLRIGLVIAYLVAVRRVPDARRLFQNHGAEHQVVALHESDGPFSVDNARDQPTSHPRCGTTFFVIVVFVSALAHGGLAAFGSAPLALVLAGRVALVPIAAAVAYEVLLLANRRSDGPVQQLLLRPGLALQSLTVLRPGDDQIEVALAALEAVVAPVPEVAAPASILVAPA